MNIRLVLLTPLVLMAFAGTAAAAEPVYSTVLDRSSEETEVSVKTLTSEKRYVCNLKTLACDERKESSILPQELTEHVSYFVSPENEFAIATEYVPYRGARHTAYRIHNGELSKLSELGTVFDISRIRWGEGGVALITFVDGTSARAELKSGTMKPVTGLPSGVSWATLSPNGSYLAYYQPATQSRNIRTFGVVNLDTGQSNTFDETVAYWDLLTEGNTLFAFSPDSTKLVYLSDRGGYPTLYQVNLGNLVAGLSLEGTPVITKPYSVADFAWRDAQTILFTANRDNQLRYDLYAYTPSSGSMTTVLTDVSYDSALYSAGDAFLVNRIEGTARVPYVYDTKSGTARKLPLDSGAAQTARAELVTSAGMTGAWLPEEGKRKTLLVWLHGGPYRQSSLTYHPYFSYAGYDWMLSHLQEQGVGVLKLDYPGSMGYGRAHAESITGNVGTLDVAKTHAAVEAFAKEKGYQNVHLMGNSYGGYLALRLLAEHNTAYEGAFSINGVTDWDALTAQLQTSIFNVQFNGVRNPANDALYAAASIRDRLSNLEDKDIVIAHGTNDKSVPFAQATLLSAALAEHRIDAELLEFEDEDHVYARPETFESLCKAALAFVGGSNRKACKL